jgi:CDP-glucose 4,6-dehydratase
VRQVVELAQSAYGMGQVTWGDGTDGPHEAGWLALEVAKARTVLGVKPRWALAQSVQRTVHWYRQLNRSADALGLCQADISAYEAASDSSPAP